MACVPTWLPLLDATLKVQPAVEHVIVLEIYGSGHLHVPACSMVILLR